MPHPNDKEYLAEAARAIDAKLPDNHGFILLVAPYNTPNPITRYAASCERTTAIAMLKEFLFRIGEGEEWMNHIK